MDVKKSIRTDLNVPYEEKEEAKALGVKWDYVQKVWYVQDYPNMEALGKWLPETAGSQIELLPSIYLLISNEKCYRCRGSTPVYSLAADCLTDVGGGLIESFAILNYIENLSQILIELLSPISSSYYKSYSKTTKSSYYNNHCIHCKAMLGDFFMHAEPNGSFFPTSVAALEEISIIELPLQVSQKLIANYKVGSLLELMNKYSNKLDYQTWCLEKKKNHSQVFLSHSLPLETSSVETRISNTNEQDFKPNILMYWRSIEFFTPQKIPKPNPSSKNEPIYNISQDQDQYLFPWEDGHPFQNRKHPPKTAQQHLVYCAVYPHSLLKESLESEYGKDDETFDARLDGECSVFAFTLTQDGRPLFDTFVLSMSAWALGQLLNHKIKNQNWCDNFDEDKTVLSLDFATHCELDEEDIVGVELKMQGYNVGKPLSGANLFYIINRILKALNLKLENALTVRVKSQYVSESNAYKSDDQDFLNSFFVHDLKRVGNFCKTKHIGSALQNYLSSNLKISARKKTDIRQDIEHVYERLDPNYFPKGRWPSAGHYPLVLSQQFAINSLFNKLSKKGGIFAVNGPPGTGKTTLLRDLIANVVVKRAECLAKYKNSSQILSGETIGWQSDKYKRTISTWPKEFEDFSVVVSSANNGAVENVTYEIPGESAIDESWKEYTDYFSSIATDLIEKPSWALIAARLGNKSNRNTFIHKFWYGSKSDDNENQTASFLQLLKQYEEEESTSIEWENALVSFNNALDIEEKLRTERIKWYALIETINLLKKNLVKLQSERKT